MDWATADLKDRVFLGSIVQVPVLPATGGEGSGHCDTSTACVIVMRTAPLRMGKPKKASPTCPVMSVVYGPAKLLPPQVTVPPLTRCTLNASYRYACEPPEPV